MALVLVVIVLSAVLTVSGLAKLLGPAAFRRALIDTYGFPRAVAAATSVAVPVAEIAIGIALLTPYRTIALLGAAIMLTGVVLLVLKAWITGNAGDCGCLGILRTEPLSGKTVLRAITLLVLALVGTVESANLWALEVSSSTSSLPSMAFAIVGIGVMGALIWAGFVTFGIATRRR